MPSEGQSLGELRRDSGPIENESQAIVRQCQALQSQVPVRIRVRLWWGRESGQSEVESQPLVQPESSQSEEQSQSPVKTRLMVQ